MINNLKPGSQGGLSSVHQVKDWLIRNWREDAPSFVDKMLQDRADAERQLNNPDWKIRMTALSILQLHWEAVGEVDFADRCEDVGLHDVHPQVRSCAFMTLGVCYESTNDRRIGKLLAQVVLDESQPSQARRGAYLGLYYLCGRRFRWAGALSDPPAILRIPEEVNWVFVRSFS
jgi:hypothetical protein